MSSIVRKKMVDVVTKVVEELRDETVLLRRLVRSFRHRLGLEGCGDKTKSIHKY